MGHQESEVTEQLSTQYFSALDPLTGFTRAVMFHMQSSGHSILGLGTRRHTDNLSTLARGLLSDT